MQLVTLKTRRTIDAIRVAHRMENAALDRGRAAGDWRGISLTRDSGKDDE